MKHIVLPILLLLTGCAGLHAQKQPAKGRAKQQPPEPQSLYNVSFAPAPLIVSTLDAALERRMTNRNALLAQGHFGFRKIQLWESLGGKYFNFGGRLEYRAYLGKNAVVRFGSIQGPYFAGWLRAQNAHVQATLQKKDYTLVKSKSMTPGIGFGWKFPLSRKWPNVTIDLCIGGGYRFGNVSGRYAEKSRSILFKDRGLTPAVGLRVGYSPAGSKKPSAARPGASRYTPEIQSAIDYHDRYPRKKRKTIERALSRNRLDPGKVNGKFDEQTIQAIRQFQRKQGLTADGMAGPATLKKLLKQ